MKYNKLTRLLKDNNYKLCRQGKSHEIWGNGIRKMSIPRHKNINLMLANRLIKEMAE